MVDINVTGLCPCSTIKGTDPSSRGGRASTVGYDIGTISLKNIFSFAEKKKSVQVVTE